MQPLNSHFVRTSVRAQFIAKPTVARRVSLPHSSLSSNSSIQAVKTRSVMMNAHWNHIVDDESLQRSSHNVSAVDGNAYIFGGELLPREPRDNKLFKVKVLAGGLPSDQLVSAEATTSGTAPAPRVGSASAEIGSKIFLFSGRGGTAMKPVEEQGCLHQYDTATSNWTVLEPTDRSSPYPQARSYHCMTSDNASTLFVHAGCPESGRLSDLWAFDVTTRKWTELPQAPAPQRGGTSIAYTDGKLYRMNGFDGKTEQGGSLDIFDVAAKTWSTKTFNADSKSGPEARSVGTLLPLKLDGKRKLVTLFGERDPSSLGHAGAGKMLSDWWIYDIAAGVWEQGHSASAEVPVSRGWFDAAALDDRRILVAGGLSESNDRLRDIWVLTF